MDGPNRNEAPPGPCVMNWSVGNQLATQTRNTDSHLEYATLKTSTNDGDCRAGDKAIMLPRTLLDAFDSSDTEEGTLLVQANNEPGFALPHYFKLLVSGRTGHMFDIIDVHEKANNHFELKIRLRDHEGSAGWL